MAQPPANLQALLSTLTTLEHGTGTLRLDTSTLTGTGAASLVSLFSDELQLTSLELDQVRLPPSVTGTAFQVSGQFRGVTLDLTFADVADEIAIEAVFEATALPPLQTAFSSLPGFFGGIQVSGATAGATVPGLSPLSLSSPVYGLIGRVTPSSGVVATSSAPRVAGLLTTPNGPRGLAVELKSPTAAYRLASSPASAWTFDDLAALLGGTVAFVDAIGKTMLPTTDKLQLRSFELDLDPDAPDLSFLSLDVADSSDQPGQDPTPLWSAVNHKLKLTDVVVTLDLAYSASRALSLAGTGAVEGQFILGSIPLDVEIPLPPTGIWSLSAFPNLPLPGLGDVVSLLKGEPSPQQLLPAGLADVGGFDFTYLRVAVLTGEQASLVEFTIGLASRNPWTLIPGPTGAAPYLALESLQIRLTIDGSASVTGSVVGTLQLDGVSDIVVSFARRAPAPAPWRLDVISPAIALPSLGHLTALAQGEKLGSMVKAGGLDQRQFVMTGLNLGLELPPKLTNLGLTLQLADADPHAADPLAPTLHWDLIPGGHLTLTQFSFGFQIDWTQPLVTTHALGTFVVSGLEFDLKFAGASGTELIAEYTAEGDSGTVDIKQLIHNISPTVAEAIPEGLEFDVHDALLAYLSSGPKYLFAMDVSLELPVSKLPLVGDAFPASAKMGFKSMKVVVASAAMTADDVATINGMSHAALPTAAPGAKGDAIPAGVSMVAELELGSLVIELGSPPSPQTQTTVTAQALPAPRASSDKPAPPAAPGMWKDVGKSFGPAELRRVGVAWADGRVWLLVDGGFAAAGLTIDLQGLGIGVALSDPKDPRGVLHGLAVSLSDGPVQISGGLIEVDTASGPEYDGEILIEVEPLQLAALGSWSTVDGHPSLFVFAMLNDPPLGGPAFFYVTGLAFGFGYNRSLVLPPVDKLAAFPFVSAAMADLNPASNPFSSTDPTAALQVLAGPPSFVPATEGVNWVAAGVRFTSFELIQSFALLTVEFGRGFELALLGLSALVTPPDEPEPIVFAELALEATFSSASGLVAVSAQLTPESYLLSRACRLTGGFAFYLWTKDVDGPNGPRAGEFVVTLGGYHPEFDFAKHGYPAVPRLGANWQVSTALTVKAGVYVAVTPSCVMAGGSLEAVWHTGDADAAISVQATFAVEANFLLGWKPFYYSADGSITITGRLTINIITTITITIHLGVWVSLCGPPFAGTVHVDLDVASFTIHLGDSSASPTPIEWPAFVSSFLPQTASSGSRASLASTDTWCGTKVLGGLERDLTKTDAAVDWVLNGERLVLQTFAAVPCATATMTTGDAATVTVGTTTTPFGIGPVGLADGKLTSEHAVKLHRLKADGSVDNSVNATEHLGVTPVTAELPRTLWSADAAILPTIAKVNGSTPTLSGMLTGMQIEAHAVRADQTPSPVPASLLQSDPLDGPPFAFGKAPDDEPATVTASSAEIAKLLLGS